MSTESPAFVCPACLFRGMRPAMDKKGRPYFRCETCSAILFVRLGSLGVHTVANTLRLLDNPEAAAFVRAEAYKDLGGPGQGLLALLGVGKSSAAPPAGATVADERQRATGT